MLLLVTIFVTTGLDFASGNTLELLREACPYSYFCTVNSTKLYLKSNDTSPCCFDCFCDEYCSILGDCCPDVEPDNTVFKSTKQHCRSVGSKPLGVTHILSELPRYRYIDFCPDGYNENPDVYDKCKEDPMEERHLEDLVIVSDPQGRLFKNRHCAVCHGAQTTTSWDLEVEYCLDAIDTLQMTLTESQEYLFANCTLTPIRPREVPLTARTRECTDDTHICSIQDDSMRDGCINGPYMPYIETVNRGYVVHKNVLCFKCRDSRPESSLCPVLEYQEFKMGETSFRMLLDTNAQIPGSNLEGCDESKTNDPNLGSCRKVFCPPFQVVSHGKCIPLSSDISDFFLAVNVVYTLTDTFGDLNLDKIVMYDSSVIQYYLRRIRTNYSYSICNIMKATITVHTTKTHSKFTRLLLEIIYKVTTECSLKFIGEQIQKRTKNAEKETWLLNEKTFEMAGQITFFQDPPLYGDPLFHEDVLMVYSRTPVKVKPVTSFFVCPYFKLSLKEYMTHVETLRTLDKKSTLFYFTPNSRCLEGFYPLNRNEVAVCIENYHAKNDGLALTLESLELFMGILIVCICAYVDGCC